MSFFFPYFIFCGFNWQWSRYSTKCVFSVRVYTAAAAAFRCRRERGWRGNDGFNGSTLQKWHVVGWVVGRHTAVERLMSHELPTIALNPSTSKQL